MSWYACAKADAAKRVYLRYTDHQGWSVSYDGEVYFAIAVEPSSVITGKATFLHYSSVIKDEASSGVLLVVRDGLPVGEYRRMIVKLKLSAHGQG